jgi:hypothetical protein
MQRLTVQLVAGGSCLAAMLLAGCEQTPVAGTLTPVAEGSSPAASISPAPANAGPVPSTQAVSVSPPSSGFSLPIGGDILPLPGSQSAPAVPTFPPLHAKAPAGGNVPGSAVRSPASGGTPADLTSPAIHLSAGVAVPQSLPTGTAMGVSVDYRARGSLSSSSRYVFVVKSAAGEAVNEVQLESSGTLAAFFLELKPEHRPFTVRIEEISPGSLRRVVISNEVTLKTDY